MNRREVLGILGAASILPLLGPLTGEERLGLGRRIHALLGGRKLSTLDSHQNATVVRIAEMIIPETDTPGATTVRVNEFIDLLLTEWYSEKDRASFLAGLAAIDDRSRQLHGARFVDLNGEDQADVLRHLDGVKGEEGSAESGFGVLKGLTIYGYFTSEIVMKDVIHYQVIPGRFDGCIPV